MERKDTIQNAYRLTGSNNFYDGISIVRFCKTPYGLIALLTYVVLDHTGIGRRHFTGGLPDIPAGIEWYGIAAAFALR